jgi:hypothetical protein
MDRRSGWVCGLAMLAATTFGLDGAWGQTNQFGQTIINGPTAANNAAAAGSRGPGNMVGGGISRAADRISPLGRIEITETDRPTSPIGQTLPDAIDTAFAELNQFMFFLLNQFLQREGLPPIVPGDIITPPDDSANGDDRDPRSGAK